MNIIDVNDDMRMAYKVIHTYGNSNDNFKEYDRVYPYTTEIISGYMSDSCGKTVLSVIGSGDHYLNLICKGAKEIDSFDINRLAIYFLSLKKAAIKALSKREFFEFMTNNSIKHYHKIRPFLNMNSLKFWDYYVNNLSRYGGIQSTRLFHLRTNGDEYLNSNFYMSDNGFELLKNNIFNHKNEEVYAVDIYSLTSLLNKKYDSIYLSNIVSYQKNKERFKNLVLDLFNYLNNDGELFYGYFYDNKNNNINYYLSELPESKIIKIPKLDNSVDKMLVLKK